MLSDVLDKAFQESERRFNDVGRTIFDLYKYKHTFSDFNYEGIPLDIFDHDTQSISKDYMMIKKGTAYYLIYTGAGFGGYLQETLTAFPDHNVVARFTEFDLFQVYYVDDTQKTFRYELLGLIQSEFTHNY